MSLFADCFKGVAVFMQAAFMAGACVHKWHSAERGISLLYSKECHLCGHARNDVVSPSLILVGLLFDGCAAGPIRPLPIFFQNRASNGFYRF